MHSPIGLDENSFAIGDVSDSVGSKFKLKLLIDIYRYYRLIE